MSRPSQQTDKLLIRAGRKLLPQTGVSGLSLRQVASRARVNLGVFNYHFKNKDEFVLCVLQEIYEEFFASFQMKIDDSKTPSLNLQDALFQLGVWIRDNRKMVLMLLKDIMNGEKVVLRYVEKNFHRHITIIYDLLLKAQEAGEIKNIAVINLFPQMLAAISAPSVASEFLEKMKGFKSLPLKPLLMREVLSDEAIADRIDCLLDGMRRSRPQS